MIKDLTLSPMGGEWISPPPPPLNLSEGSEASSFLHTAGGGYIMNQDPKFQPPSSKTLVLRAKWKKNYLVGNHDFSRKLCENTKEILSSDFKMAGNN